MTLLDGQQTGTLIRGKIFLAAGNQFAHEMWPETDPLPADLHEFYFRDGTYAALVDEVLEVDHGCGSGWLSSLRIFRTLKSGIQEPFFTYVLHNRIKVAAPESLHDVSYSTSSLSDLDLRGYDALYGSDGDRLGSLSGELSRIGLFSTETLFLALYRDSISYLFEDLCFDTYTEIRDVPNVIRTSANSFCYSDSRLPRNLESRGASYGIRNLGLCFEDLFFDEDDEDSYGTDFSTLLCDVIYDGIYPWPISNRLLVTFFDSATVIGLHAEGRGKWAFPWNQSVDVEPALPQWEEEKKTLSTFFLASRLYRLANREGPLSGIHFKARIPAYAYKDPLVIAPATSVWEGWKFFRKSPDTNIVHEEILYLVAKERARTRVYTAYEDEASYSFALPHRSPENRSGVLPKDWKLMGDIAPYLFEAITLLDISLEAEQIRSHVHQQLGTSVDAVDTVEELDVGDLAAFDAHRFYFVVLATDVGLPFHIRPCWNHPDPRVTAVRSGLRKAPFSVEEDTTVPVQRPRWAPL